MDNDDSRFEVTDPRFATGEAPSEVSESRFDPESGQPVAPPAKRNQWMPCLVGCSVVLLFGLVVIALVGFWIWQNRRDLMAAGAEELMNQTIDATDLPPQDRQAMKVQVRRIAEAVREGRITNEQLMRFVRMLADSPLLTLFAVTGIEQRYFARSGLGDEEKADGRRTLHRFLRGAIDGAIDQRGVDAVLTHIGDRQADGTWRLRPRVSDAELRAALAEAERQADQAGIPQEPEPFDAPGEFKRIVDKAIDAHEP